MNLTINASFLPHDDPDASLAFYRDTLGFEVRSDVGQGRIVPVVEQAGDLVPGRGRADPLEELSRRQTARGRRLD